MLSAQQLHRGGIEAPAFKTAPRRLRVALTQKRYGATAVLGNVAFDAHAGEIIAVLGASGCGKSTLLRAIAGLDLDWLGEIEITPADKTRPSVVGVVYQEPRLMPWLTVEENIAFARAVSDTKSENQNSIIDGLLQEVLLEDARQYWPKQLSGGMAQRVSIARALVREPDVLLMDEPFSSIDVITRRSLHALTREITVRHQTATVIVTHDPIEAVQLADRVLVLAKRADNAAAIVHDFRPSQEADEKHRQVEAIIAALDPSTEKCAA